MYTRRSNPGKQCRRTKSKRQRGGNTNDTTARILLFNPSTSIPSMSSMVLYKEKPEVRGFYDLGGMMNTIQSVADETDENLYETMHGMAKPPYREMIVRLYLGKVLGKPQIKTIRIFFRKGQITDGLQHDIRANFNTMGSDIGNDVGGLVELLKEYTSHTEEELHTLMQGFAKPPYREIILRITADKKLQFVSPTAEAVESTEATEAREAERLTKERVEVHAKGPSSGRTKSRATSVPEDEGQNDTDETDETDKPIPPPTSSKKTPVNPSPVKNEQKPPGIIKTKSTTTSKDTGKPGKKNVTFKNLPEKKAATLVEKPMTPTPKVDKLPVSVPAEVPPASVPLRLTRRSSRINAPPTYKILSTNDLLSGKPTLYSLDPSKQSYNEVGKFDSKTDDKPVDDTYASAKINYIPSTSQTGDQATMDVLYETTKDHRIMKDNRTEESVDIVPEDAWIYTPTK